LKYQRKKGNISQKLSGGALNPYLDPQLIWKRKTELATLSEILNSSPAHAPYLLNLAKKTASPSKSLTIEGMR
jgi:hypothetical protein